MTVGEVIALLCMYCSNEDELLMCEELESIEVHDGNVLIYLKNSSNIRIQRSIS